MINYLTLQKNQEVMHHSINLKKDYSDRKIVTTRPETWQVQMADLVTNIDELLTILNLVHIKPTLYLPEHFSLRVPRHFIAKMTVGDAEDPLLKQVLPRQLENVITAGYSADPLAERDQNPIEGLLHKYKSRILVTLTAACAIHCRYCFRQHFDYQTSTTLQVQIEKTQHYIKAHPEVNEVILSGGDPLSLSHRRLCLWLDAFESLNQIQTIRIHTRLPLVIPERLSSTLNERLSQSRCSIVMVIHTNHSNELDEKTVWHLQRTRKYGITLLNQTVLLAGINDNVDTQAALSQQLFSAGVLPYYLHLLDKVSGSAHFAVNKLDAIGLYWQLLTELPGYLVPKLVEELPLRPYKTPVDLYFTQKS